MSMKICIICQAHHDEETRTQLPSFFRSTDDIVHKDARQVLQDKEEWYSLTEYHDSTEQCPNCHLPVLDTEAPKAIQERTIHNVYILVMRKLENHLLRLNPSMRNVNRLRKILEGTRKPSIEDTFVVGDEYIKPFYTRVLGKIA